MKKINVDLTCPDCGHQFKLDPQDILKTDSISCPHCQCLVTEEELTDLKQAINYMLNAN